MTTTGQSVLKHPDREAINEKLLAGESVESVASWLRMKHSRNDKMWVNKMTLQAYRRTFLNLDEHILKDLRQERKAKIEEDKKRRAVEAVQSTASYQVAKAQYAEGYVRQIEDHHSRLEELYLKVNERIAILETQKISHLNDKVIADYMRLLKDTLKDYFDMQQKLKDEQETHIDIDIRKITDQVKIIKSVIRETITENCPELWPVFCQKMKEKLENNRQMMNDEIEEFDSSPVNINIRA